MPHHFDLVGISERLAERYLRPEVNPWLGSPFAWIKSQPSRRIGKIGEELFEEWCKEGDAEVRPALSTHYDRIVNGHRMEIKFSTRWETGRYAFEQIRSDQNYDFVACLGISPDTASCWVIPKRTAVRQADPQHSPENLWLKFRADEPPAWMAHHGGSLDDAWAVIERLGQGRH